MPMKVIDKRPLEIRRKRLEELQIGDYCIYGQDPYDDIIHRVREGHDLEYASIGEDQWYIQDYSNPKAHVIRLEVEIHGNELHIIGEKP